MPVELNDLIGTSDVAEILGITKGQVRRLTKKDIIHGNKVAGAFLYDRTEIENVEIPASALGSGGRSTRRADGRIKYGIYLKPSEAEALAKEGFDVIDRAAKREARRVAKTAVEEGEIQKASGETWYDVYERYTGQEVDETVNAEGDQPAEAEGAQNPFEGF